MQGFKLTDLEILEILSVYATAEYQIAAVATTPGWTVIGAFTMPASADIQVDVIGSVSDASLQLHVRLYDVTPGSVGEVSGSTAQITSITDVQSLSGVVSLEGGHIYQFQAEVTGDAGDGFFGDVRRATLRGVEE